MHGRAGVPRGGERANQREGDALVRNSANYQHRSWPSTSSTLGYGYSRLPGLMSSP